MKFKNHVTIIYIICIVIDNLSYQKTLIQVFYFIIYKNLEINFDNNLILNRVYLEKSFSINRLNQTKKQNKKVQVKKLKPKIKNL